MQAIPAMPESLCIVEMGASDGGSSDEPGMNSLSMLYLNIGLQNGVLLRTVLDGVTGEMADTRARYLGGKPVKLFKIKTRGNEAVSVVHYNVSFIYDMDINFVHIFLYRFLLCLVDHG